MRFWNVIVATAFICLLSTSAKAQLGWTLSQIESKYGKASHPYDNNRYTVLLKADNFPTLVGGGYNRIAFEFFQGKVANMSFDWDLGDYATKQPSKKKAEVSDAGIRWTNERSETAYLPYDTAKTFALAYIDVDPNPRAIRHETTKEFHSRPEDFYGARLAGGTEDSEYHEFDYNGWHINYSCTQFRRGASSPANVNSNVSQSFSITPAPNNSIYKQYNAENKERSEQQTAAAEKEMRQRQETDLKRETR